MSDDLTINGLPIPRQAIDQALKETSDKVTALVPSTPSPAFQAVAFMLVRYGIIAWGAVHAEKANTVTGDELQMIVGIVAIILMVAWGSIAKKVSAWREHEGNKASGVASANATMLNGVATVVTVQPPASTGNL